MNEIMQDNMAKINGFSRRELSESEVYVFPVVLCDNEVDRDFERFSNEALKELAKLFIGKTGIFDHNPTGANQTARIFHTEVIVDENKQTSSGEGYTYLKAMAYMVRTSANVNLIKEIDAGIKKEVSVSCTMAKKICSICGGDLAKVKCSHKKGRIYGTKKCYAILDKPTDAYEWSFVAVPAQKNAGVTKHFNEGIENEDFEVSHSENGEGISAEVEKFRDDLRREVMKLSFVACPQTSHKAVLRIAEGMTIDELLEFKNELFNTAKSVLTPQTFVKKQDDESGNNPFQMRKEDF